VDRRAVDLWMGTLSKSLASCGGFVAGSKVAIEYLRYTTPGFIYSVGISPANTAAALAALRKLEREPERVATLQGNARRFLELCRERGAPVGSSSGSAVVPCIVGASDDAFRLSQALFERGIHAQPIVPPAVEEGQARLRFFVTSQHSDEQLVRTADALAGELAKQGARKRPAERDRTAVRRRQAN
jgi:7-keto-8-aminopelargonate synthetase-like enzyme